MEALSESLTEVHCRNCDVVLAGKFCHNCGQKRIEPTERTLKYFFIQFLGSAFFLENNFIKNLWYVIARPGRQVIDFIEGRQKRWMPPFSLFLLINLFYFWYTPLTDMNLSLREQLGQYHKNIAIKMVTNRLKERDITLDDYAKTYNAKSSGYSNSLIILHVPLLALFVMAIYYRKNYFFVDYFIVSLYFLAFLLLMALTVVSCFAIVTWIAPSSEPTIVRWFGLMLVVLTSTYVFVYLRNIFRQRWWLTLIKTMLFVVVFYYIHMAYRTILFFIIFWAT